MRSTFTRCLIITLSKGKKISFNHPSSTRMPNETLNIINRLYGNMIRKAYEEYFFAKAISSLNKEIIKALVIDYAVKNKTPYI